METPALACTKCQSPLSPPADAEAQVLCGACGTVLRVHSFPALSHPHLTARLPEGLLADGEAGCFFHPAKKAVSTCEGCGRFLCPLCEVEWEGARLCPSCLAAGRKKGKIRTLENHRMLYDHLALAVAAAPVLFWPLTCVTGPAALFLCIRFWKTPGSIVSRSKFRFILALVISLFQIAGWIWLVAEILHWTRGHDFW